MKLLALLLAAAAAAQPGQQFDLVCTATGADTEGGAFEPRDVHLRIDLTAGKWCEDPPASMPNVTKCAQLHPIADVQPGAIWFEKEDAAEKASGRMHWRAVNRETGVYHYVWNMPYVGLISIVSRCDKAPFSGFPRIETKF